MNQRPSGYEPDELPDCSTPRHIAFWVLNYITTYLSLCQDFFAAAFFCVLFDHRLHTLYTHTIFLTGGFYDALSSVSWDRCCRGAHFRSLLLSGRGRPQRGFFPAQPRHPLSRTITFLYTCTRLSTGVDRMIWLLVCPSF